MSDMVLVGAEAVVENGGIINRVRITCISDRKGWNIYHCPLCQDYEEAFLCCV